MVQSFVVDRAGAEVLGRQPITIRAERVRQIGEILIRALPEKNVEIRKLEQNFKFLITRHFQKSKSI